MQSGTVMLKWERGFLKLLPHKSSLQLTKMSLYAVTLALHFTFSWHLPNQIHSSDCQTVTCETENMFPLLQSAETTCFTPLQPMLGTVHHDLRYSLCIASRPWRPISWSSKHTFLVLMLLPETVQNSVESDAKKDRRLCATCFSTLWACSVSLCGLITLWLSWCCS